MDIVFTIASRNYGALAGALMDSLAAADPAAYRVMIVTDGLEPLGRIDAEVLDVWSVEGVSPGMALYYNALEFNTAVKPFVFQAMMRRPGVRTVTYLDPDILVFRPLSEVRQALADASIALTPHLTRPLGDQAFPDDLTILRSGVYNLGFLGVRPGADTVSLIGWWAERCRFDCRVDFAKGLFTDQRWMDMAPGLVDSFAVLRQPDLNLAYWNLPARTLVGGNGVWSVDGRPLTFFHFSGFDPRRPELLSRYQNRIVATPSGPLAGLLEHYAAKLVDRDHARWSTVTYGHGQLADGRPVSPLMRRCALSAARGGEMLGLPRDHDPAWFDTADPRVAGPRLSRLAAAWLREHDHDLTDPTAALAAKVALCGDAEAAASQARLEAGLVATARGPLPTAAWGPAASSPDAAFSPDHGSARADRLLATDGHDGVATIVDALWRCRADLRARFDRRDPDLLAWCLGPEAQSRRFAARLLSTERLAVLDPIADETARRTVRFLGDGSAKGPVGEIKLLFGDLVRAGWPDSGGLRTARARWGEIDSATGVPAVTAAIWMARSDLRAAFDLRRRWARLRFMRWFALVGARECGLVVDTLPPSVRRDPVFRIFHKPSPPTPRGADVDVLWVRETLDAPTSAPPEAVCFVAATGAFVKAGRPCPAPASAVLLVVETEPGAAPADLVALRAHGVTFARSRARWSAATAEALDRGDLALRLFDAIEAV